MSFRPYPESGALRRMRGLPDQAFDMLVSLLARICDAPYDPVFSAPTGALLRRVADVGDFGFIVFAVDEAYARKRQSHCVTTDGPVVTPYPPYGRNEAGRDVAM